ncbi:phosphonate metabolism protein/1,5-bisphosphokinase (PRPP-forming) PhnN [Rubellimicrobium roseum]|uniref:Ribose 1,5-bisphosphate phosphokinase PhnN n=1 Tax=Rubellimicrobium roseum TaxID=687525 RepID=A0A5C4NBC9_9RHOB|nr:phosphonate metabolism protein/1,5-bisphosphokinase (PRPP-forming) PhnN [Rubellimicrobium roseum]TNC71332.1 phosphonate metabolism protein/1,5-bisphosphokinase (PRPP-forming) PhnN [Rubellimicrobium roseum]
MSGRLVAVVGPSGVGKDSLIDALCGARPWFHRVRRTITRPPGAGERFDSVSAEVFERMRRDGAFCLHWAAHGLRYGLRAEVEARVAGGQDAVANLSRGALPEAALVFPRLLVLNLTASPEVLAERLAGRGREEAEAIRARLGRADLEVPDGPWTAVTIRNDGPLEDTLARAVAALQPERA